MKFATFHKQVKVGDVVRVTDKFLGAQHGRPSWVGIVKQKSDEAVTVEWCDGNEPTHWGFDNSRPTDCFELLTD